MRFSAGKSDDAERLARFMNAKQRLFGVRARVAAAHFAQLRRRCAFCRVCSRPCPFPVNQVDVEALNGQLEAKRQAKQQEKALDE
jgi:hypothetical protein